MFTTKVSVSVVAVVLVAAVAGFWLLTYQRFQAAVVTEQGVEGEATNGAGAGTGGATGGGATTTCTTVPDGEALPEECQTGGGNTGGSSGGGTNGNTGGSSGGNASNGNTGGGTGGSTGGGTGGATGGSTGGTSGSSSGGTTSSSTGSTSTSSDLPATNESTNEGTEDPVSTSEKVASPFGALFSSANTGLWWVIVLPLLLIDLILLLLIMDARRRIKRLEKKNEDVASPLPTNHSVATQPVVPLEPVAPTIIAEQPVETAQPNLAPTPDPTPSVSQPLEVPPQAGGLVVPPTTDQSGQQPPAV